MATTVAKPKSLAEIMALAKSIRAQPTDPAFVKRHGKPGAVPVGEGQRYVDMVLNPQETTTTTLPSRSVGNASKPAPATASKPAPSTASKPAPTGTARAPPPPQAGNARAPPPPQAGNARAPPPPQAGNARAPPPPQAGNARAPPPPATTSRQAPPVNTASTAGTAGTKKGAPAPTGRR